MPESNKSTTKSPPAYFLSLSVENIRCFGPKQTLDLSDGNGRPAPWTIILGDNGFGKTTLLQCLAGMQPINRMGYNINRKGQSTQQIVFRSSFSENVNELMKLSNAHPDDILSKIESSIFYGSKISPSNEGAIFNSLSIETRRGPLIKASYANLNKGEDIGQLVCYSYGAKRQIGSTSLVQEDERKDNNRFLTDETSLINAEEWYLQADYAAKRATTKAEKENRERQIELIRNALKRLLPDVDDIEIVESDESHFGPRVIVTTPFGKVRIKDLSLGYRTLIAWVVDLAHRLFERYPKSKNPLAEPAVVLVDEIDLHLHPRFQRILMSYLTGLFPNTQFIATAHSPLVVQASSNANIVLLRREGDHVVIDNDVENINNWRVDQILTSELFGLESTRSPEIEPFEKEREKILGKPKLTAKDKKRLEELESKIGYLPVGENKQEREAMDIIRRLAQEVEKVQQNSK